MAAIASLVTPASEAAETRAEVRPSPSAHGGEPSWVSVATNHASAPSKAETSSVGVVSIIEPSPNASSGGAPR